jgi:hypothetical protein
MSSFDAMKCPLYQKGIHPVFRRIFCFCAVMAIIGTLFAVQEEKKEEEAKVFTSDLHKKQGIECVACHGVATPTAPVDPVSGKVCLVCHESIDAVAEKTQNYMPNPHRNHITETSNIECTECHHGHKEDTPTCFQCHQGMPFNKQ